MKPYYIQVLKYNCKITFKQPDIFTITTYYENGNKRWEGKYRNGQPYGTHMGWYENGSKWWINCGQDDVGDNIN